MTDWVNIPHTQLQFECQADLIHELAGDCDNEYYMSAGGPSLGNKDRARRGLARIQEDIAKFRLLEKTLRCSACREEVVRQIQLQQQSVAEIKKVWDLDLE